MRRGLSQLPKRNRCVSVRGSQLAAEFFDGFFLALPLVGEQQFGAFAAERLGDRVGKTPSIGHAQDERRFSFHQLRHEPAILACVRFLTRADGEEFLTLAAELPLHVEVETFALVRANDALARLRDGRVRAAAVLLP